MRVPWKAISIRPDPTVLYPALAAAAAAGVRPCVPADLQLESAHTTTDDGIDGQLSSHLRFKSVAATECAIPNGRLDVRLIDAAGATLPGDRWGGSGPPPTPATFPIRPGQLVFGAMRWSVDIEDAAPPAYVAVYPGWDTGDPADAIVIPVADLAVPDQPWQPSRYANRRVASHWQVDRVADPGALATLTATMAMPATIVAGAILRYSVTLTNSTLEAVPLSPCPDFAHVLLVKAGSSRPDGGSRGTLNCREAPPAIDPGKSVTFDFEYDTAGHPPGHGALIWRLSSGPVPAVSVQARLTIQP